MTRVLLIGLKPETVDYTDPALPPGTTAEKIAAGLKIAVEKMTERGWQGELCLIAPDETAEPQIENHLSSATYGCVVVGGGIRVPPKGLALFERVMNAIRKGAPNTPVAFNTRPEDTADAAARWIPPG